MSQEKFDPIKEFTNIRDSISQTVEKGLRGVATNVAFFTVDIYETKETVVICSSPIDGLRAESLEISMENGVLTISGETVDTIELPDEAKYLLRERKFGSFSRKIAINLAVKPQEARAKLKHGQLIITIPRVKSNSAEIIEIESTED